MNITANRYYDIGVSIIALSTIIIIHELCHYALCIMYGVHAPQFSIGFGPAIKLFTLAKTTFQLGIIPLGGYVSIDPTSFAQQPFSAQLLIMFGGIIGNIITGTIAIMAAQSWNAEKPINDPNALLVDEQKGGSFMGPMGIVSLLADSLQKGSVQKFLLIWGAISAQVGLFNLLPIPFLDGGRIAQLCMAEITKQLSLAHPSFVTLIFACMALSVCFTYLFTLLRQVLRR